MYLGGGGANGRLEVLCPPKGCVWERGVGGVLLLYGFPPGVSATGTAANVPKSTEKMIAALQVGLPFGRGGRGSTWGVTRGQTRQEACVCGGGGGGCRMLLAMCARTFVSAVAFCKSTVSIHIHSGVASVSAVAYCQYLQALAVRYSTYRSNT